MPLGGEPLTNTSGWPRSARACAPAWQRRAPRRRRAVERRGAAYRYDPSAFRQVFERRFTYLAGVYAQQPPLRPAAPRCTTPHTGRRWTYAELWADAGRLAAGLAAGGVAIGDVVVFSLFNGGEFVLVWLAAQRLGAIAAPINFRLSSARSPTCSMTVARRRSSTTERWPPPPPMRCSAPMHAPALLAVGGDAGEDGSTADRPLRELLQASPAEAAAVPDLPAAVSTYDETTRLYTSGTTGMPKGVSLSGIVDVLSAHDVIMHFPLSPEDRTLNMTPWFHRGGLYSGGPNPVLYVGAEAVALRAFDPATCSTGCRSTG